MSTVAWLVVSALMIMLTGCGTTQKRAGTEQLLLSDSVDHAVDQVDLSNLAGRKVFLDSTYVVVPEGYGFISSNYIISALRQKLITSGCLIQTSVENADYVVEARVGALGSDSLEVVYGIPANNLLGQAASVIASAPAVPAIPEIAFGKRNGTMSTAKLVLFAYHRDTGTPVWQSGSAIAKSDAKDSWFMGIGPLQRGSIYNGVQFAGARLRIPGTRMGGTKEENGQAPSRGLTVAKSHRFISPDDLEFQLAEAAAGSVHLGESSGELASATNESPPAPRPASGVVPASHSENVVE